VHTKLPQLYITNCIRQRALRRNCDTALASIIAGGSAALIAAWLFGAYHTPYAIRGVHRGMRGIEHGIAALMTNYTGKDIHEEY
jgi:hypothetical protein